MIRKKNLNWVNLMITKYSEELPSSRVYCRVPVGCNKSDVTLKITIFTHYCIILGERLTVHDYWPTKIFLTHQTGTVVVPLPSKDLFVSSVSFPQGCGGWPGRTTVTKPRTVERNMYDRESFTDVLFVNLRRIP